jgi:hypothetical protein
VNSRSGVILHRGACERALNKGLLFLEEESRVLKPFEKVFVVNGARLCICSCVFRDMVTTIEYYNHNSSPRRVRNPEVA